MPITNLAKETAMSTIPERGFLHWYYIKYQPSKNLRFFSGYGIEKLILNFSFYALPRALKPWGYTPSPVPPKTKKPAFSWFLFCGG